MKSNRHCRVAVIRIIQTPVRSSKRHLFRIWGAFMESSSELEISLSMLLLGEQKGEIMLVDMPFPIRPRKTSWNRIMLRRNPARLSPWKFDKIGTRSKFENEAKKPSVQSVTKLKSPRSCTLFTFQNKLLIFEHEWAPSRWSLLNTKDREYKMQFWVKFRMVVRNQWFVINIACGHVFLICTAWWLWSEFRSADLNIVNFERPMLHFCMSFASDHIPRWTSN